MATWTFDKLSALLRKKWLQMNKPSTVATKLSKLQTFCTARGCMEDVRAALADPIELTNWLETRYANDSTRLNMISTLVSAIIACPELNLKKTHKHLFDLMCSMSKARNKAREQNETPEYLQQHDVTYAKLQQAFDDLPVDVPELDRILIGLYTCIPPRRLEHGTLQFVRSEHEVPTEANCVILSNPPVLVFRDYKTSDALGEMRISLSNSELLPRAGTLGQLLLDSYLAKQRTYVFKTRQGPAPFSLRVKTVFAKWTPWKQLTVRLIRKLYATHLASSRPLSTADRDLLAKMCGHTLHQSDTYKMLDSLQKEYDDNSKIKQQAQQLLEEVETLLAML